MQPKTAPALHYAPQPFLNLQTRGAVGEGDLYVVRRADAELEAALGEGIFCYVLAPRQIGKSSLRVRIGRRLAGAERHCVHVDLTLIGGSDTAGALADWIFSIASEIALQLGLDDPLDFFTANRALLPMARLVRYLRQVVLSSVSGRLVIFIDEIDFVRKLQGGGIDTDTLFAAIRALASSRADDPEYRRLTFCLLGVASPGDLVQNPEITPFNVGRAINLEDFSRAELAALAPALATLGGRVQEWLDAVHAATCGHPYMTLALCQKLRTLPPGMTPEAAVARCVEELFVRPGAAHDPNLLSAVQRLSGGHNQGRLADLLSLYRRLLHGERVPAAGGDECHAELQLCGIVTPRMEEGRWLLRVRNPIVARVLDEKWIAELEGQRVLGEALRLWRERGHDSGALLRSSQLAAAQDWLDDHPDEATREEHQFVRLSIQAAQAEDRQKLLSAQVRFQRRAIAGLSLLVAALIVVALGLIRATRQASSANRQASDSARIAGEQRQEAVRRRNEAEQARIRAEQEKAEKERALRKAVLATQSETLAKVRALEEASRATLAAEGEREAAARIAVAERASRAESLLSQPGRRLEAVAELIKLGGEHVPAAEYPLRVLAQSVSAAGRLVLAKKIIVPDPETGRAPYYWLKNSWFSPAGTKLLALNRTGSVFVIDPTSYKVVNQLFAMGDFDNITDFLVVSPDDLCYAAPTYHMGGGKLAILPLDNNPQLCRTLILQHGRFVLDAAFSPDHKLIATASADQTAGIWSYRTGERLFSLPHNASVWTIQFFPDGDKLLTTAKDNRARIWDVKTGKLIMNLPEHGSAIRQADISKYGDIFATLSATDGIRIWDQKTGRLQRTIRDAEKEITSFKIAPDGKQIASANGTHIVTLWDPQDGRRGVVLQGQRGPITDISYSRDGKRIATSSEDRTAMIWDSASGLLLYELEGHTETVNSIKFAPKGNIAVSSSNDQTVRIWDLPKYHPKNRYTYDMPITTASWMEQGRLFVVSSRFVKIVDVSSHEEYFALSANADGIKTEAFANGDIPVIVAALSHDEALLAVGLREGGAGVWNTKTKKLVTKLASNHQISSVSFSADATKLGVVGNHSIVKVFAIATGKELFTSGDEEEGDNTGSSVAFSPDDKLLAWGGPGTIRVWNLATKKQLYTTSTEGGYYNVRFSADGARLVAPSSAYAVTWDVHSNKDIEYNSSKWDTWSSSAFAVALSPKGNLLAVGGLDGGVRLWSPSTGAMLGSLTGHIGEVRAVAFSPDGSLLASGGADRIVRIWDVKTRKVLLNYAHHLDAISHLEFSKSGDHLLSASFDNSVEIMPVSYSSLMRAACQLLLGQTEHDAVKPLCRNFEL